MINVHSLDVSLKYKLSGERKRTQNHWNNFVSASPLSSLGGGSNFQRHEWERTCGHTACVLSFSFPLHRRAECKCHSFEKSGQVQVLPPYISLTPVNVVAMAPGYLLNARRTFAEIIRSISQREGKQLHLQNKGQWSRYFWGAAAQNRVFGTTRLANKLRLRVFHHSEVLACHLCHVGTAAPTAGMCPCDWEPARLLCHSTLLIGCWRVFTRPAARLSAGEMCTSRSRLSASLFIHKWLKRLLTPLWFEPTTNQLLIGFIE